MLKAGVRYFHTLLQKKTLKKFWKMPFISLKKLFLFLSNSIFWTFLFPTSPFYGRCWIYKRSWLKINSQIYDVITCLASLLKRISDFTTDVFLSEKEHFKWTYLLKKPPRRTKMLISPVSNKILKIWDKPFELIKIEVQCSKNY